MGHVHLLLGPVGSGKSTFARTLCRERRAVRLVLDEWMARLFRPDRPERDVIPWYMERSERCLEQIWQVAEDLVEVGTEVVLELGLIQRAQRRRFFPRIDDVGHPLTIYLLDAPREVRRARVEQRNAEQGETFSMVVPLEVFEMASDLWEPLDEDERRGRDVREVMTGPSGA